MKHKKPYTQEQLLERKAISDRLTHFQLPTYLIDKSLATFSHPSALELRRAVLTPQNNEILSDEEKKLVILNTEEMVLFDLFCKEICLTRKNSTFWYGNMRDVLNLQEIPNVEYVFFANFHSSAHYKAFTPAELLNVEEKVLDMVKFGITIIAHNDDKPLSKGGAYSPSFAKKNRYFINEILLDKDVL
jgi:hypothetical protein